MKMTIKIQKVMRSSRRLTVRRSHTASIRNYWTATKVRIRTKAVTRHVLSDVSAPISGINIRHLVISWIRQKDACDFKALYVRGSGRAWVRIPSAVIFVHSKLIQLMTKCLTFIQNEKGTHIQLRLIFIYFSNVLVLISDVKWYLSFWGHIRETRYCFQHCVQVITDFWICLRKSEIFLHAKKIFFKYSMAYFGNKQKFPTSKSFSQLFLQIKQKLILKAENIVIS